ncbi:MAG TPA: hypothetical protein PLC42_00260 [Parachlamydiaceae bacterium]|nr:hypothetical protein [Parachlamydiaceae bacterium]
MVQTVTTLQHDQEVNLFSFGKKVDSIDQTNKIFALFKQSFSQQLVELKALKKENVELKNYYSLLLYHKVLHKSIDLLAEKKHTLKKTDFVCSNEIFSISELNSFYAKYFQKYCKTPYQMSWKAWMNNSSLIFSHPYHFLNPGEIQQKKELADKGYSMIDELEKWMSRSFLTENESFENLVLNLTKEFLDWADDHPKAASHLISDVALTCSVLLEKELSERLFIALDAMIVSRLFFDSLGLSPEYEKVEDDDLLKFRALADFMTYCPKMAAIYNIIKKTAGGSSQTLFSWVLNAIKETAGTAAAQKIVHLVPKGKEKFVSFLIDTVRGKEVREILAHQRSLALVQVAGTVRKVIKNSHPVLLSLEIWWKTIFEATGEERKERIVAQILIPVTAVFLFIVATKTLTSFAVFCSMIALSVLLTRFIDEKTKFRSKRKVEQEIKKREKELKKRALEFFLSTNSEMKQHLATQSVAYIHDLQKRNALSIVAKSSFQLNDKSKTYFYKIKGKYLEKLKSFESGKILSASEAVAIFNEVLNLKELRIKLEGCQDQACDVIIFSLVDELIKEWLQKAIEKAFKDQLIESCELSNEELKTKLKSASQQPSLENYFKEKAKSFNNPYQKKLYKRIISQLGSEKQHSFFSI